MNDLINPEPRPLLIAIAPYGVYVQFCTNCQHGQFVPVENNKYLACEKCGLKMAVFDPKHTAILDDVGENRTFH